MGLTGAFELLLIVALVAGWITQVALPSLRGEPLFPTLWRRAERLEAKKTRLSTQLQDDALEAQIEDLEQQLHKPHKQKDTDSK